MITLGRKAFADNDGPRRVTGLRLGVALQLTLLVGCAADDPSQRPRSEEGHVTRMHASVRGHDASKGAEAPAVLLAAAEKVNGPAVLLESEFTHLPSAEAIVVGAEGGRPRLSTERPEELRAGRRFYVYRKNRLVGVMEVEHVAGAQADCRVLFVVPGETIQKQDAAVSGWR